LTASAAASSAEPNAVMLFCSSMVKVVIVVLLCGATLCAAALLRQQLFSYRDLWVWLDDPFLVARMTTRNSPWRLPGSCWTAENRRKNE
jgi:hypothetical protein